MMTLMQKMTALTPKMKNVLNADAGRTQLQEHSVKEWN